MYKIVRYSNKSNDRRVLYSFTKNGQRIEKFTDPRIMNQGGEVVLFENFEKALENAYSYNWHDGNNVYIVEEI